MLYTDYDEENYDFDNILYNIKSDSYCVNRFVAYMQKKANALSNDDDRKRDYKRRIRRITRNNRVTNSDIASIFDGMAVSTVDAWVGESSKSSIPRINYLPKLAKAFGVSTDYLLGLVPEYQIADASDYPTLQHFGIDVKRFQRTYESNYKDLEQLYDVLDALELLFSQENNPFSILKAIGQYLNIEKDMKCICYDTKDFWDFKVKLKDTLSFNPDELPACVDEFINSKREPIVIESISKERLDSVTRALFYYKLELDNEI